MKKILIVMIMLIMLIPSVGYAVQDEMPIKVIMDGTYLEMDVAPIMVDSRTMVPFRDIFEALGATITWDRENRIARGSRSGIEIELSIDRKYALVNGENVKLDTAATIIGGRTLVPLRFVSETLGAVVEWEPKTRTVTIDTSLNHELESGLINSVLNVEISMGMSEEDVIALLGKPNRKDLSEKGFYWYIYNKDYRHYVQVGIEDGIVVALGTNADTWATEEGLNMGKGFNDLYAMYDNVHKDASGKYRGSISLNSITMQVFFDSHDGNKIMAYKMYSKRVFQRSNNVTKEVLLGMELRNLDFTNVTRGLNGLDYLEWCDEAGNIARSHSTDMVRNDYFSHDTQHGVKPWERLKNGGIDYSSAAENIAAGYDNALDVHVAWMNSEGHRRNILNASLTRLGVGIVNKAESNGTKAHNTLFFTQKFYAPIK